MKKLSSIFNHIYQKIRVSRKIKSLDISSAGLDEDGTPYVELVHGLKFFGLPTTARDRKYYSLLLPDNIKSVLPLDCYRVAMDIVIRYQEGGLMLGGPRKEDFYKVKEGDTVAEMGAFLGYYSMYLAEKIGSAGKVIAIEPLPENYTILKKNIEANGLDNIRIVKKGVWNKQERMTFHRKSDDRQSGSLSLKDENKDRVEVVVEALDNILTDMQIKDVQHMIIQLNGSEIEALEGLTKVQPESFAIAARYPKHGKSAASTISEMLTKRGYKTRIKARDFVFAWKQNN